MHRYDADTFDHVDPLLGGDDALISLVKACHNRGIHVIGDLTVNHAGRGHEWFRAAQADATSPEADFFFFRRHPDDYESWYDVPSLPKLDLRSAELRRRLVEGPDSVTARWLRPPFDLDGWRVDVANMAGRNKGIDVNHAVAVAMRRTMAEARTDAYLVAEHCYDASRDLDGDGWHGVMNYLAFTRPMWAWLRDPDLETMRFLGDPVALPRLGVRPRLRRSQTPWRPSRGDRACPVSTCSARTTRHGSAACAHRPGRHVAGAGLLFTLPGVPMVFAGDEVGLTGIESDGARQPMPWEPERWDSTVLDGYRAMGALHRSSPALRRGGLRWAHASDDVLVFLRESLDERLLVQVSRAAHEPVCIDEAALDGDIGADRLGGSEVARDGSSLALPGDGPAVHVWQLDPRSGGTIHG